MRSATFRNIALGILALAAAYHLGAQTATAQAPGNPIVGAIASGASAPGLVVLANGDIYGTQNIAPGQPWPFLGNIFGGATPVQRESFGALKARYRGERGAAQPTQDR